MRIGFDAKRLFNNFTGLGNHSRTTIDILTQEYGENEYFLYTPKLRRTDATLPYLRRRGCRVVMPQGLLRGSLWRTMGLSDRIRKDGVELFHGLSNELPVGIRRSGARSIVTIHDIAFKTFPDMYSAIDRRIYDMKWTHAVRQADRIIAISQCTKEDIVRFYGAEESRIEVVYQPVAPHFYTPVSPTPCDPYMLYVGTINSRKNLLGIVKAMELMPQDMNLPLYIVGTGGAYKRTVEEYIAAHGMQERFRWLGSQTATQLQQLYTNAQLFIYPSFYEGFGLPIVEAMLSGCPVVTSHLSCLPEAAGPDSLLADPSSPEDIRDKMLMALQDTALRTRMIESGRKYALDTFHPTVLARKLMDVYKRTISL